MKNNLENSFISKFNLLNSQENSEEIIWSSDSSDYENSINDININISKQNMCYKKRKRVTNKSKIPKNISHLNITFTESEQKSKKINESPVFCRKSPKLEYPSPILTSSQRHFLPLNINNLNKSPIILSRSKSCNVKDNLDSPVLSYKPISSINTPKVRKKLFNPDNEVEKVTSEERSTSPVLSSTQTSTSNRSTTKHTDNIPIKRSFLRVSDSKFSNIIEKSTSEEQNTSPVLNLAQKSITRTSNSKHINNINIKRSILRDSNNKFNNVVAITTSGERSTSPVLSLTQKERKKMSLRDSNNKLSTLDIDDNLPKLRSSIPLIDKVKSYFDSHFSSPTSRSASISECDTENEKNSTKSDEIIEILNSQTENLEPIVKLEKKYSVNSFSSYENDFTQIKKVKYKKDGLAFRLNALKKKQNANTSLWLHERFLAANSSFILPSEDFLMFRIQTVSIKYGCHLIEVLDINNEKYLIILNNIHVHNNNMEKDAVLKVYKPYSILELTDYKLILNLCKYECVVLKSK